jgi:hypothetical protein
VAAAGGGGGVGGGDAKKGPTSGPTQCFLTHNWGPQPEYFNHKRVAAVNRLFKSWGLVTWFDDERMQGQLRKKMAEGIENTQCVVVFITELYRDKVNGDDAGDNCQYEFSYSVEQKRPQRMIPVVMEASMRNPRDWKGQLGAALGSMLYVDMSDAKVGTAAFEAKVREIYHRIDEIVGTGSSSRGPPVKTVVGGGGAKGEAKPAAAPASAPAAAPTPAPVRAPSYVYPSGPKANLAVPDGVGKRLFEAASKGKVDEVSNSEYIFIVYYISLTRSPSSPQPTHPCPSPPLNGR